MCGGRGKSWEFCKSRGRTRRAWIYHEELNLPWIQCFPTAELPSCRCNVTLVWCNFLWFWDRKLNFLGHFSGNAWVAHSRCNIPIPGCASSLQQPDLDTVGGKYPGTRTLQNPTSGRQLGEAGTYKSRVTPSFPNLLHLSSCLHLSPLPKPSRHTKVLPSVPFLLSPQVLKLSSSSSSLSIKSFLPFPFLIYLFPPLEPEFPPFLLQRHAQIQENSCQPFPWSKPLPRCCKLRILPCFQTQICSEQQNPAGSELW